MLAARAIAAVQSKLKEKKKNAKRIKAELTGVVRSHDTFLQEFQAQTDDLSLSTGGEDAHLYKVLPVFLDTAQYKTAEEEDEPGTSSPPAGGAMSSRGAGVRSGGDAGEWRPSGKDRQPRIRMSIAGWRIGAPGG